MRTIMISDDAYNKLAAIKGKKSFTELLSELADKSRGATYEDIKEFAGIMGEEEAEERQKLLLKIRKQFRVHHLEDLP